MWDGVRSRGCLGSPFGWSGTNDGVRSRGCLGSPFGWSGTNDGVRSRGCLGSAYLSSPKTDVAAAASASTQPCNTFDALLPLGPEVGKRYSNTGSFPVDKKTFGDLPQRWASF